MKDEQPRYSYYLRVDAERTKLYMLEAGLGDKTLAAKIGVAWQTVSMWKGHDWPVYSLACTMMQINPIVLLRSSQGDDGRWTVWIDSDRWLFYARAAGLTVVDFAKSLNTSRATVMSLYNNQRETTWHSIEGLAYGLDVSPLALLRVDER